jgi:hypothetical protein
MIDHGLLEATTHGIARSPHWAAVERAHKLLQPTCVCCANQVPGGSVQVHHKFPFHYAIALGRPDLELDDRNLITLCETETGSEGANHHLLVGHLADFRSSNLTVEDDALKTFHGMSSDEIRANPIWHSKVAARLKPLSQMTQADKDVFTKLMNDTYPKK